MPEGWNPLAPAESEEGSEETEGDSEPKTTAKVEIKDGAYVFIRTDSNNDGEISAADDARTVKNSDDHPGRVMEVNYDDDDENGEEDRNQRITGSGAVPNNPAALAGEGPSINVTNEDDLAEVQMKVSIACLDPKDSNTSPTEVDVYFVAPNDLLLWTASTKGHRLFRGEGMGRIPVERRLKTLTATNKSFNGAFYVEGVAPIIGNVDLHAVPTSGTGGKDSAKFTCVEIGFVDSIPDYSLDTNTDSDNFFLRQHSPAGVADYLNLDIYYSIKPDAVKVEDVKIKIYEEDMGAPVGTPITGKKGTDGKFLTGAGMDVKWADVRDGTGMFRDVKFYTVQLEVKLEGCTDPLKTPTGDADTSAAWPGVQCKESCLMIHDLVFKHQPVVHMGDGETVAPDGPVYPFSSAIVGNYILQERAPGYIYGWNYFDAWPTPPNNFSTGGFLVAPAMPRRGDYAYRYHVLSESITNDSAGAPNHLIDIDNTNRGCAGADPTLLHRGHVSRGHSGGNYCFIQYWMYETSSHKPYGVGNSFQHEGDWEMVQICIKMNGAKKRDWIIPHAATASQHYYGQTLAWRINRNGPEILDQEYVGTEDDGNRVRIFIAENAHATYFREGDIATWYATCGTDIQYIDTARRWVVDKIQAPLSPIVNYEIIPLNYKSQRGIGDWPGLWGEDDAPRGPFLREANTATGTLNLQNNPGQFHNLCRKIIGGVPQPETEL